MSDTSTSMLTEMMSVDAIADYVNNHLTYRPGWTFNAAVIDDGMPYVSVYVEFSADNSTPRNIDPRTWVIGDHVFSLFTGTREHVQCEILAHLMSIEAHEAAEFLRFDGFAPFHPHRVDGRERYSDARDTHAGLPVLAE